MSDILNEKLTLRLNGGWMKIGWSTVADAFVALMGGTPDNPPAMALDINYEIGQDDKPDFTKLAYANPVVWDEWIKLPIREWDLSINTVRRKIRVPTVIICPKFHKMPMKKRRPTKQNIRERDNSTCQYSGQKLTNKTASIDHIRPSSKGGADTWENLVLCHKEINSKKGNSFNHEVGLKLLKQPAAPLDIPICELIKEVRHHDHAFF